jgi:hypothetical protein
MSLPGLSEIEAANWDYLKTNATAWTNVAHTWESAFAEVRDSSVRPGGTEWNGDAADGFQHRTDTDLVKVRGPADQLRVGAGAAERGYDTQEAGKRLVLDAVDDAERDKFQVGEDYTVTDTHTR